jgi:hypothetical protein
VPFTTYHGQVRVLFCREKSANISIWTRHGYLAQERPTDEGLPCWQDLIGDDRLSDANVQDREELSDEESGMLNLISERDGRAIYLHAVAPQVGWHSQDCSSSQRNHMRHMCRL